MKKIYNNLNIENLTKTEWFNQFNEGQQGEILDGLEKKVDVSWYAKPEFDKYQMNVIKCGLEGNLNVSIYANPEFSDMQMNQIRFGLIDLEEKKVLVYAKPEIELIEMAQMGVALLRKKKNYEKTT